MVIQFNADERLALLNALKCSSEILFQNASGEFREVLLKEAHCCDVLYDRILNAVSLDEIWSSPPPVPDKFCDEVSLKELVENWAEFSERDKVGWFCGLPVQYNPFLSDEEKRRGGVFESEVHSGE